MSGAVVTETEPPNTVIVMWLMSSGAEPEAFVASPATVSGFVEELNSLMGINGQTAVSWGTTRRLKQREVAD